MTARWDSSLIFLLPKEIPLCLSMVSINMSKMIANQFSCLLYSILKVLEVVAPFKHFNKLKEFVAMKLPAGFPVRIGWCGLYLFFQVSFTCVT